MGGMLTLLASAAHGSGHSVFRDIVMVLAMAGLVALVAQRLRLATIPAYLLAGAIIGPGALGIVSNPEQVQKVADIAVVLLMFGIGLHTDMDVLSRGLGRIAASAVSMILLCIALLWPAGLLMGLSWPAALAAAMALSMSSTVVVLRVLQDRRQLHGTSGRITLAILVIQDLAAIAMLLVLPLLAQWAGTGGGGVMEAADGPTHTGPFWTSPVVKNGMLAILGVAAIIGVGRVVMPRLLKEAARNKAGEVLTVIAMAGAMGAAALTQLLGLNEALGAFLAGFLLAVTPYRHQLGGQVGAVRDIFGAIFFTAIGMSVSLAGLIEHLPTILIGTLIILLVKSVVIGTMAWAFGTTGNTAIKIGHSLAQAGEFSIVMLYAAKSDEIAMLENIAVSDLIAMVVVSLMVTPSLIQAADALNRRLPRISTAPWNHVSTLGDALVVAGHGESGNAVPAEGPRKRAIIAGFGLVGRAVADELKRLNISTTIVEMNPATVQKQSELGRHIVFGDVASPEVLETAGIEGADALILTIPDTETVMRACKLARELHPGLFILVRLNYVSQGIAAASIGASGVVVEEMATAEAMEKIVKKVLAAPGKPLA